MPRANPKKSFEVAARHFFHHLDDATMLQRNPLVSQFFEGESNGYVTPSQSEKALEQIRSLVIAAAKEFRDTADPMNSERASRQFAILHGCCTQKKSADRLAAELGISVRQCYRERFAIYRYVAEFIRCYRPTRARWTSPALSAFELQMDRAANRIENGDHDRATSEYKSIISSGAIQHKIEAFCRYIDLEVDLGRYSSAQSSLPELKAMISGHVEVLSAEEKRFAQSYVSLLQARLAWIRGDFERASRTLARGRMISAQFQQNSSVRFRTLYTDILSESASRAYDLGENTVAQEYVKQAKVACDEDSTLRLRGVDLLLTQVILNLFRMRAGGGVTLGEQVMLVNQARDTALQCGSMNLRLRAETLRILLQEPYEGAIQSVKCILSLANQLHNRRLTTTLTLVLADYLLDSDLWPEAGDLLCYSLPEGSYDWGTMMLLRGIYNLKRGAFQDARRCSERALQVAQRSDALRLQCSTLTALATTAYLSRHEEEAIDYILAAVPIAEQHASALSRLKTYQGAALITGKSKYAKEARNLRVVLQR